MQDTGLSTVCVSPSNIQPISNEKLVQKLYAIYRGNSLHQLEMLNSKNEKDLWNAAYILKTGA